MALVVSAVCAVAMPAAVAAHTGLDSSQPADGELVDEPVTQIALTFNGKVEPAGDGFLLSHEHGPYYSPDSVNSSDGRVWLLHFDAPLGNGVYKVQWRVAAGDGHVIKGAFEFTVEVPEAGTPEAPSGSAPASAASPDATAATTDLDGDPASEASGTGVAPTGSTASGTARGADGTATSRPGEVPSAAATALSSTESSGTTSPAESDAASAGGATRQMAGSSEAAGAQRLAEAARVLGLLATLGIVGGLAFASFIVRNEPSERARAHRVLVFSAIVLVAAAVMSALAQTVVIEDDWGAIASAGAIIDTLTAPFGIAVGLRVLGGLFVLFAPRPGASSSSRAKLVALGPTAGERHRPRAASSSSRVRLPVVSLMGAALVIVSYSFDGHTVTEGPRWLHAAANATHVYAAAVWSGGVVLLADLLRRRRRDSSVIGPLMRFSQMAAASLVLAGVAGTVMAVLVMDRVADLWATDWGRLLIAKVALVAVAAVIGARNRWVHLPAAAQHSGPLTESPAHQRLRRAVAVEAVVLVSVGVVTAFLVGASAL